MGILLKIIDQAAVAIRGLPPTPMDMAPHKRSEMKRVTAIIT
jgi:hypothetical protein